MESTYGLNYEIQSFAVANEFVITMSKACYQLGKALQPFCFFADDVQKQYGVVDFSSFQGVLERGSLIDEICEYREGVFKDMHLSIDKNNEMHRRWMMINYLLSVSICYMEVPKYTNKDGFPMHTYDKFLCTRNPFVMASWVGDTASAMQGKYSYKLQVDQYAINNGDMRFVKLNSTGKGNSITMPRSATNIKDVRCVPLFMLYAFTQGVKPYIEDGIVEFKFLKDNNSVRTLATTINPSILMEYYKDNNFVNMMLNGIDIETVQQGGLMLSSKINRGYIKVPELGSSIYDSSGCRSLNLARILSCKQVSEVDRSFIHVDLNSVVDNFKNCVEYAVQHFPYRVQEIYASITGKEPQDIGVAFLVNELFNDVDAKSAYLSTAFHRQLHLFMVERPEIFPLYTGKPVNMVSSSSNYSVEEMPFF